MTYAATLLSEIQEGMAVFDRDGNKAGTVIFAYPGDGDRLAKGDNSRESIPLEVQTMVASEHLPVVMEERLLSYGFVKVRTGGVFSRTRFALPDQVAGVDPDNNKIHLSVAGNELLKS